MFEKLPRRKPTLYEKERSRLFENTVKHEPHTPEYKELMARIDELDLIIKRSSQRFQITVSTLMPVVAVAGVYSIQQLGGLIVPKALDMLVSRTNRQS